MIWRLRRRAEWNGVGETAYDFSHSGYAWDRLWNGKLKVRTLLNADDNSSFPLLGNVIMRSIHNASMKIVSNAAELFAQHVFHVRIACNRRHQETRHLLHENGKGAKRVCKTNNLENQSPPHILKSPLFANLTECLAGRAAVKQRQFTALHAKDFANLRRVDNTDIHLPDPLFASVPAQS